MGVEVTEHKRQMLLHSIADLARSRLNMNAGNTLRATSTSALETITGGDAAVLSASSSMLPMSRTVQSSATEIPEELALLQNACLRISQSSPRLVGTSVVETEVEAEQVEEKCDKNSRFPSRIEHASSRCTTTASEASNDHTSDESIMYALALLRKFHQLACDSEHGEAAVQRVELDQILYGFSRALETVTSTWDERSVENTMQKLFDTHSNVFDESMQHFFIQNFLHESESVKTFRGALRRTSMLRRCLLAMYQSDHLDGENGSNSGDKETVAQRWSIAVARVMKQKEEQRRRCSLEVCPEITNPSVVLAVQSEIAKIDTWNFDVFAIATAVPGQPLCIIANALLEQYEICCHFRTTKTCVQSFLRHVERRYHAHPYHNSEHAADVTQTLHHFLSVGNFGSLFTDRIKCTALLAAIIHDVGHTSYSNNFHITVNDDLAVQYVYRSPLEHMHCALAFQLLKEPQCNILQGLTKVEQHEVRSLITDMVLATDNSVHSAFLGKLDILVRRATEEGWKVADPDDDRLVLQMILHAADVSNPSKSLRIYLNWTERIKEEFYQQGDKERELLLPVSIGYDREQPIPLEKMQAGFIIGIVRPLFLTLSHLPCARLNHCVEQLDANLMYWQDEINRNKPQVSLLKPAISMNKDVDAGTSLLVAVDSA
ncbi:Cyclic nucleotide phosphodiesterase [Plasmopara halstedii]|uniref:Cyclic nucleotide phosphodiesterase n=1 Tax=Plasmopara halstedii TaxID=4781 RepID=A0A0N7L7J1_PLAHL|nr:Cyclic nucleotide phosphodiesterase [Plasmopara halstedii]CEG47219.1 Cyclic nucleotide phosphodiesterase [Plasmopara halstedii]|eukprot:XP_024583588.1 Cyclic nucleotide phosphodiesterase [Plasmopara halstedii]